MVIGHADMHFDTVQIFLKEEEDIVLSKLDLNPRDKIECDV